MSMGIALVQGSPGPFTAQVSWDEGAEQVMHHPLHRAGARLCGSPQRCLP